MLHIRVLIKPDRVIIFDTAGTVESEVQRRFKWHLERNIKAGLSSDTGDEGNGLVYEHRLASSWSHKSRRMIADGGRYAK